MELTSFNSKFLHSFVQYIRFFCLFLSIVMLFLTQWLVFWGVTQRSDTVHLVQIKGLHKFILYLCGLGTQTGNKGSNHSKLGLKSRPLK